MSNLFSYWNFVTNKTFSILLKIPGIKEQRAFLGKPFFFYEINFFVYVLASSYNTFLRMGFFEILIV